jgi:sporulation protein YlmC with PRC-barrel domain
MRGACRLRAREAGVPVGVEHSMAAREPRALRPGSRLRGRLVRDRDGAVAGSISELIVDAQRGRLAYAMVASGGFVGVGERLFAVPWTALQRHGRDFVVTVTQAAVENAPAFDPSRSPSDAPLAWHERVHAHFAARPYWT